MAAVIELCTVSKVYVATREAPVVAVNDVSLRVEQGDFLVIVGRSGSGKTTLLNLAAGLARPTSGQVLVDGTDIWVLTDREQSLLRNRKFGFVFQFPSLLPSLTALENVLLPTVFAPGSDKREASDRAAQLLGQVGLEGKLGAYPRQLSAGQQQRVVVARALMNQPEVLFADEPTSNLDERTEREIMALLQDIHAHTRMTMLLVTHTAQLISYGTRAVEMAAGCIARELSCNLAPT
ncbi:MAG: ABC transporter ATP-binding protein [Anaerolineae bacterium]